MLTTWNEVFIPNSHIILEEISLVKKIVKEEDAKTKPKSYRNELSNVIEYWINFYLLITKQKVNQINTLNDYKDIF